MSVVSVMFLHPSRNDGGPHRNVLYTKMIHVPSAFLSKFSTIKNRVSKSLENSASYTNARKEEWKTNTQREVQGGEKLKGQKYL